MWKCPQFGVLSAAIVGLLCAGCGEKKAAGPEVGLPADVMFVTDPPGACLYFDGDSIGATRPADDPAGALRVPEVPWGEHRYELRLEGYETFSKKLNVSRSSTIWVQVELVKLANLEVLTSPPGAEVYLDGEKQDGVTPLTIETTEGKHQVEVRLEGHFGAAGEIAVSPEEGGASFLLVLEPYPEVDEVRIGIIDQEENAIKEEYTGEPFTQRYFKTDAQNRSIYVQAMIIFSQPLAKDCSFLINVYWTPLGQIKEQKVLSRPMTVQAGKDRFIVWFRNHDTVKETFMQAGDYVVRVFADGGAICEQPFSVR